MELKIGYWYTMCCHRDLKQITANNIDNIKDDLECEIDVDVFKTKLVALNEILTWYEDIEDINEVKKMIEIEMGSNAI